MDSQSRLPEWRVASYAVLYLPVSVALLPVGVYVQPHYAELGISLITMAAIIFVARLSDVFTDPLIGFLSDKLRTPIGRRRPWILAGTPLLMYSVYMLFVPPENPSVLYFGFWVVMIYLAFTIVQLPYFAWGAELSTDYHDRTRITGRREQFHYFGVVIATALPLVAGIIIYLGMDGNTLSTLLENFSAQLGAVMSARAGNPGAILVWLALFIVVALPVTALITTLFVREPDQVVIPRRKPTFIASVRLDTLWQQSICH